MTGGRPVQVAGTLHRARFAELDTVTLYALLRLRVDVFVVEQQCPYPDLDGRDTDPTTVHVWLERDGEIAGCLRVTEEPGGGSRIGRVAVLPGARRGGAGAALVRCGVALARPPVFAAAQAHLVGWYAGFGFAVDGEWFMDDGILHVPMRLE